MTHRFSHRGWCSAAAVVSLALVGCGGATRSEPPVGAAQAGHGHQASASPLLHDIPAAAARTLQQRAKIGWKLSGAAIFGHVRAPVFGSGTFDLARARGTETIDLPEIKHQEPGTEHAIFLPTEVYLQPKAGALAVLPHGKKWLSAPVGGSESVSRNFPQFVAQAEGVNPILLLNELRWGATRAEPLGPGRQIVDHAPTQRYRVAVDLPRALAAASGPGAQALSQAIQEQLIAAHGVTTFPVLTSVDHQGRVVQMLANWPGTGEGRELMAISHFGSGPKHPVTAPPQGQVVDITSITPSGERENNGGGDTDGG
ncbi:MAG: hypothetical protein ACJ764_13655 [Solirubrobacteraceae bacterium]